MSLILFSDEIGLIMLFSKLFKVLITFLVSLISTLSCILSQTSWISVDLLLIDNRILFIFGILVHTTMVIDLLVPLAHSELLKVQFLFVLVCRPISGPSRFVHQRLRGTIEIRLLRLLCSTYLKVRFQTLDTQTLEINLGI